MGLSFDVPDWVPVIGGETFGFEYTNNTKALRRVQDTYPRGYVYKHTKGEMIVP